MIRQIYSLLLLLALMFTGTAHANISWQLSKQANGIQVYVRDTLGSSIKSFKGVITIPARLTALIATIEDVKAYPQFLHHCKSAKSLKEVSNNESYKYIVTNMPWPVKDRDAIVHSQLKQNNKTKQIVINMSAAPEYLALQSNRVRISKMKGRWILTPEKDGTKVVYEMTVDPAGSLPKWLVNTMAVDMPFNTLNNLRTLVKRPLYQQAKRAYITD